MSPAVTLGRSDGIHGVQAPFHFVQIYDKTEFDTDDGAQTTRTFDLPICLPGDTLLAVLSVDGVASATTVTFPADSPSEDGWITIANLSSEGENDQVSIVLAVKIAEESDSGGTVDVDFSPGRECCCVIYTLLGAQNWSNWHGLAESKGHTDVGQTAPADFDAVTAGAVGLMLSLAVIAIDDNRTVNETALDNGYARDAWLDVPGSGGAGITIATFVKEVIVQAGAEAGPTGTVSWTNDEDAETAVFLIPATAGDLEVARTPMTILNPDFDTNFDNWIGTLGGYDRNSANGEDGSPGYAYGGLSGDAQAHQDVPIPAALEAVADAGKLRAEVNYWGNETGSNDREQMTLYWVDDESPENILGGGGNSNGFEEHGGVWEERQSIHCAPVGARFLRIELDADASTGINQGSQDSLTGSWIEAP